MVVNYCFKVFAFTEHGALMLANVLNSERAAQTSVQVVRAFVRLRQMLAPGDLHSQVALNFPTVSRFPALRPKRQRAGALQDASRILEIIV